MKILLPDVIAKRLEAMGVDVEALVVELLSRELNLDPRVEAEAHLELARKLFEEGKRLVDSDPVQASEKLYKAAEECIKALAEAVGLEEAVEARRRGRWTLPLLDHAARKLGERIDENVYHSWDHAYFLHVEGFHEARLEPEQVKARLKYVEELVRTTIEVVARTKSREARPSQH